MRAEQRDARVRAIIASYRQPDVGLALIHLLTTLTGFVVAFGLAIACLVTEISAVVRLPGLMIAYVLGAMAHFKLFVIQHDCAHDSYLPGAFLNRALGRFCALITLSPFAAWREQHLEHHGSFARLDDQAHEDIELLTVQQFKHAPAWRRLSYRVIRSPTFFVVAVPVAYVLLRQRIPTALRWVRIWSCASHTVAIVFIYGGLFYWFGAIVWWVVLPPLYLGLAAGSVVILAQHHFESAQWIEGPNWEHDDAALNCSSYLSMPSPLEWVTGYVGYHYLHHFGPKIPMYHLTPCHLALAESLPCQQISIKHLPRITKLVLWSHELHRLVTFREAKALAQ